MDDIGPPTPLDMTYNIDAMIHTAAQRIEHLISRPTYQDAPKLREMVRRMIERITISRHESGAIEVAVRGRFAGVTQAGGLVERPALQTTEVGRLRLSCGSGGVSWDVGCGGEQPPRDAKINIRFLRDDKLRFAQPNGLTTTSPTRVP